MDNRQMITVEYEGPVMVRPLYRGVILCEWPDAWDDLVEQICRQLGDRYNVATGWTGRVKLRIEMGETALAVSSNEKAKPL